MFLTIITFILVLSLLVFVHELGHFLSARKFGLRPEEFGFGFPPRAWGIYKAKNGKWKTTKGKKQVDDAADTIYSINWLPLGGFVKLGEDDADISPNANHFHNKPIWQRLVMLLAGVTMNMVLAAVLITLGFMIGLPQATEDLHPSARISDQKIQVVSVLDNTPAALSELKIGDAIISINNEDLRNSGHLQALTAANTGNELTYVIKRADVVFEKQITPITIEETGSGGIGIGIVDTGLVKYPIHIAIWEGVKSTGLILAAIFLAFFELFKSMFGASTLSADIAGPVGIAVITGQVVRMGFVYVLQFAAMLSINLAVINALPFPALDGGRVLFLIIEKIKGSPVKRELEGAIHYIGFALLMLLVLAVTFKDLSRFSDSFKALWQAIVG